jgi:hypothetical protein
MRRERERKQASAGADRANARPAGVVRRGRMTAEARCVSTSRRGEMGCKEKWRWQSRP